MQTLAGIVAIILLAMSPSLMGQSITGGMQLLPAHKSSPNDYIASMYVELNIEAPNFSANTDLCWRADYSLERGKRSLSKEGCLSRFVLSDLDLGESSESWTGDSGIYTWNGKEFEYKETVSADYVGDDAHWWQCSDSLELTLYYGSTLTESEIKAQSTYQAPCGNYAPEVSVISPDPEDILSGYTSYPVEFDILINFMELPEFTPYMYNIGKAVFVEITKTDHISGVVSSVICRAGRTCTNDTFGGYYPNFSRNSSYGGTDRFAISGESSKLSPEDVLYLEPGSRVSYQIKVVDDLASAFATSEGRSTSWTSPIYERPLWPVTKPASTIPDNDGFPGEAGLVNISISENWGSEKITKVALLNSGGRSYDYEFDEFPQGNLPLIFYSDGFHTVEFQLTTNTGRVLTQNYSFVVENYDTTNRNVSPVVSIIRGSRDVSDYDGESGETVFLLAEATDSDGSIAFTQWLIGEEVVAEGTSANLSLPDGATTVTFRATDDDGDSTSISVIITVAAPFVPNKAPVVSIIGGSRDVPDSDGSAGETVSFSATATDEDGEIESTSWFVDGKLVAEGTSANLSLRDGARRVTFRATDDDGERTSISVIITVAAPVVPNKAPEVSIIGGSRDVPDSDGSAGETVSFSATATDEDGEIESTSWLVGEEVVATGTSANLSLPNGATTVTFRATDDDGDSTSTRVTVKVGWPRKPNEAPMVAIPVLVADRSISDLDGVAGEVFSVTATAFDFDGSIISTSWLIGGEVVATGRSVRLALSDGMTTVTFRATDDYGDSTSTSVTITVEAPVETEEEFVSEYNGIVAPLFLSEEINTVSVFDMNKLKLKSCIKLTLGGEPYSLNGYEQYDMNFNLLSLDELTFRLVDFRPFNLNRSSNQFGETPDCSGQFELSSNVYKDIVAIPGATGAGNFKYDYFDLVLDLIDMDSLLFRLREISIIAGDD